MSLLLLITAGQGAGSVKATNHALDRGTTVKLLFTADTHFGHIEAISFFGRPFSSLESMNSILIDNWNSIVEQTDVIYHLGDFGFWSRQDLYPIFQALNGHKILIVGNNDEERTLNLPWVDRVKNISITVGEQRLFMSHKPRNRVEHTQSTWYLHGHRHGNGQQLLDVGVDAWNFFPITFEQAKRAFESIK